MLFTTFDNQTSVAIFDAENLVQDLELQLSHVREYLHRLHQHQQAQKTASSAANSALEMVRKARKLVLSVYGEQGIEEFNKTLIDETSESLLLPSKDENSSNDDDISNDVYISVDDNEASIPRNSESLENPESSKKEEVEDSDDCQKEATEPDIKPENEDNMQTVSTQLRISWDESLKNPESPEKEEIEDNDDCQKEATEPDIKPENKDNMQTAPNQSKISWTQLQKLAKKHGINPKGKKRVEIEKMFRDKGIDIDHDLAA